MNKTPDLRVISLGAGRQSSAMLLMAQEGRFGPPPEFAIFSDTGWEPQRVYDWLTQLQAISQIPIVVTHWKNIKTTTLEAGKVQGQRNYIPFYTMSRKGKKGKLMRQCTDKYKIAPIRRHLRSVMSERGLNTKPDTVELWIGIGLDEIYRAAPSNVKYIKNRHPLIEEGITTEECVSYLNARGLINAPKSSCIGCPFHRNDYWRELKATDPAAWDEAVKFDMDIRRLPGIDGNVYVHDSRIPLGEVNLNQDDDSEYQFVEECKGICGV